MMGAVNKPGTFPQGTQRIARIGELSEPNAYVLEPATPIAPEPSAAVQGPVSDAELASAIVGGEAPMGARRARRVTSAYASEPVVGERKILTVV